MRDCLVEEYTKTVSGSLFGFDSKAKIEFSRVHDLPPGHSVAHNGHLLDFNSSLAKACFYDLTLQADPALVSEFLEAKNDFEITETQAQRFVLISQVSQIGEKLGAALFKAPKSKDFCPEVEVTFIETPDGLAVGSFSVSVKGEANNSPLWTNYGPLAEP